jgi:hypothetical protein
LTARSFRRHLTAALSPLPSPDGGLVCGEKLFDDVFFEREELVT